jgi:hypothetical protein
MPVDIYMHHIRYTTPTQSKKEATHACMHVCHTCMNVYIHACTSQVQETNSRLAQELEQLRKEKLALEEAFKQSSKAAHSAQTKDPNTPNDDIATTVTTAATTSPDDKVQTQNLDHIAKTAAMKGPAPGKLGTVKPGTEGTMPRTKSSEGKEMDSDMKTKGFAKKKPNAPEGPENKNKANKSEVVIKSNKSERSMSPLRPPPGRDANSTDATKPSRPEKEISTHNVVKKSTEPEPGPNNETGVVKKGTDPGSNDNSMARRGVDTGLVRREKSVQSVSKHNKSDKENGFAKSDTKSNATSQDTIEENSTSSSHQSHNTRADRQRSPVKREVTAGSLSRDVNTLNISMQSKASSPAKKHPKTRSMVSTCVYVCTCMCMCPHTQTY